jgi:hypothetical protein
MAIPTEKAYEILSLPLGNQSSIYSLLFVILIILIVV